MTSCLIISCGHNDFDILKLKNVGSVTPTASLLYAFQFFHQNNSKKFSNFFWNRVAKVLQISVLTQLVFPNQLKFLTKSQVVFPSQF